MKKIGRPTKYHKKFCKKIIDYFDIEPITLRTEKFYYKNGDEKEKEVEVASVLPTITRFAISIGIDDTTLVRWTKKHKDFCTAYNKAKKLQEDIWLVNSMKGLYNSQFAIFAGKNMFGWKDKNELEHSGNVTWKEEPPK